MIYDATERVIIGCMSRRHMNLSQSIAAKGAVPAFSTRWFRYGYLNTTETVTLKKRTRMLKNLPGPHPSRTVDHALHRSEVTFLNLDDEVLPEVLPVFVHAASSFKDPIKIGEQLATCGFRLLHISTNHDES